MVWQKKSLAFYWLLLPCFTLVLKTEVIFAAEQRIYKSPYYLGRGDCGIATADNHEAIFYNPAGLAWGKGIYKETVIASPMIEVSNSTKDLVREVAIEKNTDVSTLRKYIGKNQHIGVQNFSGLVFRRVALGAIASSYTDILIAKSKEEGGLEVAKANAIANAGMTFSLAEAFFDDFVMVGATAKVLQRQQAGVEVNLVDAQDESGKLDSSQLEGKATATGGDLGLMLRSKGKSPLSLGLNIENVGGTKMRQKSGVAIGDLPQTLNLGFAVEPGTKSSKISLFADYRDITGSVEKNPLKRIHLGLELTLKQFLGFMGGLNQGYPSAGVFLNLYFLRMDLGTYTEEVGDRIGSRPDSRAYFRLVVGF